MMRFRSSRPHAWKTDDEGMCALGAHVSYFQPMSFANIVSAFADDERPGEICPSGPTIALWMMQAIEEGFVEVVP